MTDMYVKGGVGMAIAAAGSMVAVPFVLSYVIREWNAATLTSHDTQVLSVFVLYASILGAVATGMVYLYGCHKEGTLYRLFFGMASGAIIVTYSYFVIVSSGLTSVLSRIGLQLDATFVAMLVAFASVILFFQAGEEYIASKWDLQESMEVAEVEPGDTP